jgi:competence ComEA-like helix-hairpin-helix protein
MFAFTRNERIAVMVLVFLLIIGGVLSWLDKRNPEMMEEFRVVPGSPPAAVQDADPARASVRADTTRVTAPRDPGRVGPEADSVPARLNINTASAEELEDLPRIGPVLAGRIVAYRSKRGPFRSVSQLVEIDGVGDRLLLALEPLVTVGQDTSAAR